MGKYEYGIIMRLPQFTTRHTPMSHFQWSTVLSSDDWQPWHGFTGCQDSRVSWWQIYIFIRKIWMRHHIKSWISFEKESRKKLNSYVCGGSISWSKVFSTKQITRQGQAEQMDGWLLQSVRLSNFLHFYNFVFNQDTILVKVRWWNLDRAAICTRSRICHIYSRQAIINTSSYPLREQNNAEEANDDLVLQIHL